jgi:hypothetical protein
LCKREPADSLGRNPNVIGGSFPSLTSSFGCIHQLISFITAAIAAICLLTGCHRDADTAIRSAQAQYESWLRTQKPFLTGLPQSVVHSYRFSIISYAGDPTVRPSIEYYLKAGQWDGLINLTFVIDIDARLRPINMHEESVKFFRLPGEPVPPGKDREQRRYRGLKLETRDMENIIKRVIAGESFEELRKQATLDVGAFRYDDSDDWKNLRTHDR